MYPERRPYKAPVGTYTFLGPDDIIRADDLVRQTTYQGDPSSDYLDHDSITHLNFCTAKRAVPAWVGKTYGEFHAHMRRFNTRMEAMRKN